MLVEDCKILISVMTANIQYCCPEREVSDLIIKHCQSKIAQGDHGFTLNETQGAGYWRAGANSAVKKVISNCVECQRFRGRVGNRRCQIFLSADQRKQHHSPTAGWTCLGPLQSNKEGEQLSNMVLCLHAWPAGQYTLTSFVS